MEDQMRLFGGVPENWSGDKGQVEENNNPTYQYYVVYSFSRDSSNGTGSLFLTRDSKMNCAEEILSATDFIKNRSNFDSVIITNFFELEK